MKMTKMWGAQGSKWGGLVLLWVLAQSVVAGAEQGTAYTDRLIVKLHDQPAIARIMAGSQADRLSTAAGVPLAPLRVMASGAQVLGLSHAVTEAEAQQIAARLLQDASVEYAEPDKIMRARLAPNDPSYSLQWNYWDTWGARLPGAWDKTTGAPGVVVAVLDTGITAHAELSGRTLPGYDFISNSFVANDGGGRDADPSDPGDWVSAADIAAQPAFCGGQPQSNSSWHGTVVAGIIGAASDNAAGIAGNVWNPKILPVRVLGKCGGYLSDLVDGALWAAGIHVAGVPDNPNPANVLNLSLGTAIAGACSQTEQLAINLIVGAGKVVVVAAGNENQDAINFSPANCSGVITVAATNRSGSKSSASNFGSVVEISAPGGDNIATNPIYSITNAGATVPGADSYGYYYGTSLSTAHISGIAALMLSANSLLSPAQVLSVLQSTARPFPDGSCSTATCGAGIVDAAAAVTQAGLTPAPTPAPASASASSGGGGGGGGCTLQPGAGFDPVLPALLWLGIGYLMLRRFFYWKC